MKVTIHYEFECTDEDIDDIMCTALEGGINYWCDNAKVSGAYLGEYANEQISRGGMIRLHDSEEDKYYELTKDKFIEGLKQFMLEHNFRKDKFNGHFGSVFVDKNGRIDASMIDADDADYIIQCAVFGEVVYG